MLLIIGQCRWSWKCQMPNSVCRWFLSGIVSVCDSLKKTFIYVHRGFHPSKTYIYFLSHSFRAGSITRLFGFNPTKVYPDYWLFHQNWKPMNVGLNLVTMQLLGNQWYSTKILYTTQADKVWNHLKVIHVWRDILPNTVEIITPSGEQISKIICQTVSKNPKGTRSSPQNLNCYQPCHQAFFLHNERENIILVKDLRDSPKGKIFRVITKRTETSSFYLDSVFNGHLPDVRVSILSFRHQSLWMSDCLGVIQVARAFLYTALKAFEIVNSKSFSRV